MNNFETSPDVLFTSISKGDLKAFELLYKSFYANLLQFCIAYVKYKEPAEEIVSDVFTNIWINKDDLEKIKNPKLYLFIAVKNGALNYIKKNSTTIVVSMKGDEICNGFFSSLPDEELQKKELMRIMRHAIDELPLQCKTIFILAKEYGMKYKEVAEILHLSTRTVETQIFRAVKKLSKTLSPYLQEKILTVSDTLS